MKQREIKFGAWDKEENCFFARAKRFNAMDISITLNGEIIAHPNIGEVSNRFILMQFTGLRDKNGVEIYEGDIIEFVGGACNYLPCGIYENQRYSIGDKMIVQCLKSGYSLAGVNMIGCDIPNRVGKVSNYDLWNHQGSLQVIGNLYQKPSLL